MNTSKTMPDYHVDSELNEYFLSANDLCISISKAMTDYVMAEVRSKQNTAHDSKIEVCDGTGESFTIYISQIARILDHKDHVIFENEAYDISDDRGSFQLSDIFDMMNSSINKEITEHEVQAAHCP